MSLKLKFNLILITVLSIGTASSGVLTYRQLQDDAQKQVITNARVMLDAALSVRRYTIVQVRPNLKAEADNFLPQSVPAYGATEVINYIKEKRPYYSYKEAVRNPTNPRDKIDPWEEEILQKFLEDPSLEEETGYRESGNGLKTLWLARPITIENESCLVCHSTPDRAPPAMVAAYGSKNGFGWKMNETLGVQVVQVPATKPLQEANNAFFHFFYWLIGIFAVSIVLLNILLYVLVNKRITSLTHIAQEINAGTIKKTTQEIKGNDEISVLAQAVLKICRNYSKARKIIKEREKEQSNSE